MLRNGFQSTRPVWGATDALVPLDPFVMFQSTRPVWGATFCTQLLDLFGRFQSTRPVWGATDFCLLHGVDVGVSIHAPRVGRDSGRCCANRYARVSIHAPRVGRDRVHHLPLPLHAGFNPRAPCGARRQKRSRLPSSATYLCVFPSTNTIFSAPKTHAPPAA